MTKSRGRHPHQRLTDIAIRKIKIAGRFADGNGLYLVVDPSLSKRWVLRTIIRGRRCDIGLGSLKLTSLADARVEAARLRRIARTGGDPLADRRREQRAALTFREAAKRHYDSISPTFRNHKHRAQWWSSLEMYVFSIFGDRDVASIESSDVLKVLYPIWTKKQETASRVKQRVKCVLDWAKASGFRTGENAVDGVKKVLPKIRQGDQHHKALPYSDVSRFVHDLREFNTSESLKLGFEFAILTVGRTIEVIQAQWPEIDFDQQLWTVPASRMKAGRIHRVPLSDRCLEILRRAKELTDGGLFVFPGRSVGRPWSNNAFLSVLKRMGRRDSTGHGFRTCFRVWAGERQSHVNRDVPEMALAHVIKDKTEAAYFRTDLFELRRDLMDKWTLFATQQPDIKGKIIPMSA